MRGDRASPDRTGGRWNSRDSTKALTEDCCTLLASALRGDPQPQRARGACGRKRRTEMRLAARGAPRRSLPQAPPRQPPAAARQRRSERLGLPFSDLRSGRSDRRRREAPRAGPQRHARPSGRCRGENLGTIRRLLGQSPAPLTVKAFEGLNHLFQPCTTGDVSEYERIGTTIDPAVLETLAAWLDRTVGAECGSPRGLPGAAQEQRPPGTTRRPFRKRRRSSSRAVFCAGPPFFQNGLLNRRITAPELVERIARQPVKTADMRDRIPPAPTSG